MARKRFCVDPSILDLEPSHAIRKVYESEYEYYESLTLASENVLNRYSKTFRESWLGTK